MIRRRANRGGHALRATVRRCALASLLFASAGATRGEGFSPDAAAARMTVPPGFSVDVVASEPLVRQPVAIDFDDRGRLWVIQYLQYPNPAGLSRVQVDRYSRTVYDRVPEPPPHGPRGADRLTFLSDTNGDGRMDQARDFVDGLNLATGFAFGYGGVFVLQVPYLLFYPDRNRDDLPDGDPEVLVTGFGMEDAHSVANSLTWGPDGWLYGAQGSTVTAHIDGIEFQQGVWRYHPQRRKFELFYEGGGNTWGVDFDPLGQLLASTNYGGYVLVHGRLGAYYVKTFGKHGALHNPFAYGYFEHAQHTNFQGGHVTAGGLICQSATFPAEFRGQYLGADVLGHALRAHRLHPAGSTFATEHATVLLDAHDTWFAPCDLTFGPDGALYVADWYDQRTAHPDPDADWDRTNGRIYRLRYGPRRPLDPPPFHHLSPAQLVSSALGPDEWQARRARRFLRERHDPALINQLREQPATVADALGCHCWLVQQCLEAVPRATDNQSGDQPPAATDTHHALAALWALDACNLLDDATTLRCLTSPHPSIREWAARLHIDRRDVSPDIVRALVELAQTENDPSLRAQLAASARQLPADQGLPLVAALWQRDADALDLHIPLLTWWAVESWALSARPAVVDAVRHGLAQQQTVCRHVVLPRLVRRYAAAGDPESLSASARLLASVTTEERYPELWQDLADGLSERAPTASSPQAVPPELLALIIAAPHEARLLLLRIRVLLGERYGWREALDLAQRRDGSDMTVTLAAMTLLTELAPIPDAPETRALLIELGLSRLDPAEPATLRRAALALLARQTDTSLGAKVLERYGSFDADLQHAARDMLFARPAWALEFLQQLAAGRFDRAAVPLDQIRRLALHQDAQTDELVRQLWGNVRSATPEEKLAEVRRLNNDVRAAPGDSAQGHELFRKHCAACHRLFGEGTDLGPDLTTANRHDRDYLLVSLVDPSSVVRKEFLSYTLHTTDGRVLSGLLAEDSPSAITLRDAKNQRLTIPRSQIELLAESPLSLMPDQLYRELKPEELRHLFAYLQSEGKQP